MFLKLLVFQKHWQVNNRQVSIAAQYIYQNIQQTVDHTREGLDEKLIDVSKHFGKNNLSVTFNARIYIDVAYQTEVSRW